MKGKQRLIFRAILILIILGGAYWKRTQGEQQGSETRQSPSSSSQSGTVEKVNGYDKLTGARLIENEGNDGDSFFVRVGEREYQFRLYYVDTPEKYISDRWESQRKRVADQGKDLGGLSDDQVVVVGKAAKEHTLDLLRGKSFTVYTKWEEVYDSDRYYAFVKLPGGEFYLSEHLIASGLARIHTKGEETPDGRSYYDYKAHLEGIEKKARAAEMGAWGL
ncbi:MAG: thermonuclease family protein [Verrucomicrobiales bacterium]|nr:thermonuclease family protein [Verrucomicrobiales bacterium]